MEELLTVDEAARNLNVSRALAYRYVTSGALPSLKIGRCRRVRPEAVREFAIRREAEAQAGAEA